MDFIKVALLSLLVINCDRVATLLGQHLHRWDVRFAVTQKDHAAKRNRAGSFGHELVDCIVVPVVRYAFIYAKEVLRFCRVIDPDSWCCFNDNLAN
jgi:hypothetical protein